MTRIAVFPGQGAQAVGMGRALYDLSPAARQVFEEVDEALGEPLSSLIFEGPAERLTLTANTQPALMATSVAAVRAVEERLGRRLGTFVDYVAGHSLGEHSALAAAGAIPVGDAARLLRLRGQAMQEAVAAGEGAMAAILGTDVPTVESVAAEAAAAGGVCELANDNGEGQQVISGSAAAVERAVALAKERGARRSVLLQVSAPFHCALMRPAAERLAAALAEATLTAPAVPVIANVTAEPVHDVAAIRDLLVRQVTARVRWRESMATMSRLGVGEVIEFGAGKVLTGLAKRGVPGSTAYNVLEPADVDALAAHLAGGLRLTMFDLTGRRALVTGASGGIGGAIASGLHAQGCHVVLAGRRREALKELAAELGDRCEIVTGDVADAAAADALIAAAEPVDILVNNAGITRDMLALRLKDADWQAVLDTNLSGAFRLSRAALRGMLKRRFGRIVNITSIVGVTGNPGQANYAAAKAGLIGMSKALAQEVAARGVTVNCVAPGFIDTAMTRALDDKQREALLARIPAARLGVGADIAASVVYLASVEAGYVTGQTLHVNGGMAMI